jgi:hypothetical protein
VLSLYVFHVEDGGGDATATQDGAGDPPDVGDGGCEVGSDDRSAGDGEAVLGAEELGAVLTGALPPQAVIARTSRKMTQRDIAFLVIGCVKSPFGCSQKVFAAIGEV